MKAIVINLPQATDRHLFQEQQLKHLGVDFEWLLATTVDQIDEGEKLRLSQEWERPLMLTEVACFLSHQRAWARVVALNRPTLILEDDACLSSKVPEFLELAKDLQGIDHLSLEVHYKPKWLGVRRELGSGLGIARLYQDRAGAAAYILWPSAAKMLINKAMKGHIALADAFMANERRWISFQADPVMAMQAEVALWRGMPAGLQSSSIIQANKTISVTAEKKMRYRFRRFNAQLGIAWRKFSTLIVASQRVPEILTSDFNISREST